LFLTVLVIFLTLPVFALADPSDKEKREYQVEGKVLRHDGKPFQRTFPEVNLRGATTPFDRQTQAGPDGRFRFKKIPPGMYTLSSHVNHAGEVRKTIVVGPGLADSKNKIVADLIYDSPAAGGNAPTVSATELSVPDKARTAFLHAKKCLSRQDVHGAIQALKKAVSIAPNFTIAWNELGTISYQTRQYSQAEVYFREALKQEPDSYPPLVNLGGTLLSLNRLQEALPLNQASVKARPEDPLAHSQLGTNYFYLGQVEKAEEHLKEAKRLDPNHFSYPQILLIEIYLQKNRLSEAIAEMDEFVRRYPDSEWSKKIKKLKETLQTRPPSHP